MAQNPIVVLGEVQTEPKFFISDLKGFREAAFPADAEETLCVNVGEDNAALGCNGPQCAERRRDVCFVEIGGDPEPPYP